MKNTYNFLILISMVTLLVFTSCESNDLQIKTKADTENPILPRTIDECDDCPVGYCCAAIELIGSGMITFQFCGVYTATSGTPCGPFNPGGSCSTISGSTSSISLDGNGDRKLFCVPTGGSFRIVQSSGSTISVKISTDYDDVSPTWENIDLNSGTPKYFNTDGNCDLDEC